MPLTGTPGGSLNNYAERAAAGARRRSMRANSRVEFAGGSTDGKMVLLAFGRASTGAAAGRADPHDLFDERRRLRPPAWRAVDRSWPDAGRTEFRFHLSSPRRSAALTIAGDKSRAALANLAAAFPIVGAMSAPYVPLRVFSCFTMLEGAMEPEAIARQGEEARISRGRADRPQRALCRHAVQRRRSGARASSRSSARCLGSSVRPTSAVPAGTIDWLVLLAKDEEGYSNLCLPGVERPSRPARP